MNNKPELIDLKDDVWFERQKIAGACVSEVLKSSQQLIIFGKNINSKDIEENANSIIARHGCSPTFFQYRGFPSTICLSVNKHLVHGIVTDYIIQEGDVVSVDLGATYEGAIADAARTFIAGGVGKSSRVEQMISTCKHALEVGIEAIQPGNRVGAIGNAIHKFCKDKGFGLIDKYGGHGISYNRPHASPFVSNKCSSHEGVRFQPNMTLAIEPMLILSQDTKTTVLSDGWTVEASDIACHFEDTIFIDKNFKVHNITN